ncbi:DNA polymerase III subunit gamma/tau, partial [Pseudooceanicola lipolyticus]
AGPQAAPADAPDQALTRFPTFGHVVELIRANRDVKLLVEVETGLRLVRYQPGRIEFEPAPGAAGDLAQRLGSALQRWSGNRWGVSVVSEGGQPTIAEVRDAEENALRAEAQAHPLMQAVLARFPKAKITSIRTAQELEAEAVAEALPEVEDEWDPFEED